ncbi:MAG: hypothetical protein CO143_03435 [Candidatus Moranbacteria bacterium CG_4_9_14_3_um_filter_45_14]|nr:MAG: hypothetical protein AUK19_03580 [Candidatus Moranbacteria bacterium CG2_30_45_14]PJA85012.1 MAG: hypothetical protein CO143_03435 [Candidatus Moranbacteria bacterium CG_4_9_14_3_um_filter_45_14]
MNLKGSSLVFSLIVLSFLLIGALSVAVVSVTTRRSTLSSRNSNISFQVADSAAEVVLQQIYKTNDDGITVLTPNGSIADLSELSSNLSGASCSSSQIDGTVNEGSYTAAFYENTGTDVDPIFNSISCDDAEWRNKVVKIRFLGMYRDITRAIEVGIKPKP